MRIAKRSAATGKKLHDAGTPCPKDVADIPEIPDPVAETVVVSNEASNLSEDLRIRLVFPKKPYPFEDALGRRNPVASKASSVLTT